MNKCPCAWVFLPDKTEKPKFHRVFADLELNLSSRLRRNSQWSIYGHLKSRRQCCNPERLGVPQKKLKLDHTAMLDIELLTVPVIIGNAPNDQLIPFH